MALVTDKMYDAVLKVFGTKAKNNGAAPSPSPAEVSYAPRAQVLEAKKKSATEDLPKDKNPRPKFRSPFSSAKDKEELKPLLFSTDINDVMAALDAGWPPDTSVDSSELPENNVKTPMFTKTDLGRIDALTYWCWKKLLSIVEYVLDHFEYKPRQSYEGMTPVTAAVRTQDYSVLRRVLKALGRKSELVNLPEGSTGMTPLAIACYTVGQTLDPTDCAKLLLRNGADVNKAVGDGKVTPLMFAILRGQSWDPRLVSYLIEYGADIDAKNANGDSALDIARDMKLRDAADMLVSAKTRNFQTMRFTHLNDNPNFPVRTEN